MTGLVIDLRVEFRTERPFDDLNETARTVHARKDLTAHDIPVATGLWGCVGLDLHGALETGEGQLHDIS
jgi:hypothetical protein